MAGYFVVNDILLPYVAKLRITYCKLIENEHCTRFEFVKPKLLNGS